MKRYGIAATLVVSVLTGLAWGVSSGPQRSAAQLGSAPDPVLAWNSTAAASSAAVGSPAAVTFLHLAMVHAAIFDAVNSIDRRFAPYLHFLPVHPPASVYSATAAAAYGVLVDLFPDRRESLDQAYATSLSFVEEGEARMNGIAVGERAAAALLKARENDGRDDLARPLPPRSGPGVYAPTPPAFGPPIVPGLAEVRPFAMRSPDQFRTPPPPTLQSSSWTRNYNEVKEIGSIDSSIRTPEQSETACFWTENTPVQEHRLLRGLAQAQGLDLPDNARLFAMASIAGADAAIGCYDSKYEHFFWRPVTAIQNMDTEINPATLPDKSWLPWVTNPAHPEYPSAHACVTGALGNALAAYFHTDEMTFSADSMVPDTTVHTYNSFSQLIQEVKDARVWGGIHYRVAVDMGEALGRSVARAVSERFPPPDRER